MSIWIWVAIIIAACSIIWAVIVLAIMGSAVGVIHRILFGEISPLKEESKNSRKR